MTMATKNEIFQSKLASYLQADKAGKRAILDTVCNVTKLHRKAAIRKFKTMQLTSSSSPERRGPPRTYTPDVTPALKDLWFAASELCGEPIHPIIAEYVGILKRAGQWQHRSRTTSKLRNISAGALER